MLYITGKQVVWLIILSFTAGAVTTTAVVCVFLGGIALLVVRKGQRKLVKGECAIYVTLIGESEVPPHTIAEHCSVRQLITVLQCISVRVCVCVCVCVYVCVCVCTMHRNAISVSSNL